jgi:Fur family ferric uptake transcriptional regulator
MRPKNKPNPPCKGVAGQSSEAAVHPGDLEESQGLAGKSDFVFSWMLGRPYDEVIVAVAFGSGKSNSPRLLSFICKSFFMDELKSTGLKATVPRQKILEIFQKGTQRHMSAEDVFKHLLQDNAEIGLATVYRVLTQFEQAGLLSRNHFESGKAVYELNEGQHHDHMVCLDCGKVEEFYDAEIEKRQHDVALAKGFVIADHALSLYAHCTRKPCPHRSAS